MGCRKKLCDAYYMEFERHIRDHLSAAGATPVVGYRNPCSRSGYRRLHLLRYP